MGRHEGTDVFLGRKSPPLLQLRMTESEPRWVLGAESATTRAPALETKSETRVGDLCDRDFIDDAETRRRTDPLFRLTGWGLIGVGQHR